MEQVPLQIQSQEERFEVSFSHSQITLHRPTKKFLSQMRELRGPVIPPVLVYSRPREKEEKELLVNSPIHQQFKALFQH